MNTKSETAFLVNPRTEEELLNQFIICAQACLSAYNDNANAPYDLPANWMFLDRFFLTEKQGTCKQGLYLKNLDNVRMISIRGVNDVFEILKTMDTANVPFMFYGQNIPSTYIIENGIYVMYLTMRNAIFDRLSSETDMQHLVLTGHSLGAAMTQMLAFDIMNHDKFKNSHGQLNFSLSVIGFASPKWATQSTCAAFVNCIEKLNVSNFNVYNVKDRVPSFPLTSSLVQLPQEFSLDFGPLYKLLDDHAIRGYITGLKSLLQSETNS